jgi:hypothetical protein
MKDLSDSFPSPRQLGVMIVNGLYDPEKDNVEECIEELLSFIPEKFPLRTAKLQIKAIISNPSQPVKLENRVKPTKENPYPEKEPVDSKHKRKALRFTVNWFGRNNQKYFVLLIIDIINNFSRASFSYEEARIETVRDIISGLLDIYLSSISNRMNEVMKVLTIIAMILIPMTVVSGIYGMNFENVPELTWPLGYTFALMLMFLIAIIMSFYFWKKGWF